MTLPTHRVPLAGTEELFLEKVSSVVLVGAVDTVSLSDIGKSTGHGVSESGDANQGKLDQNDQPLIPKDCSTNKHDMAAASFFYERCQLLGVPLTVINDEV